MKLQYATSTVDNRGSLEHRQATIDLNPTIAHVLSRDLYQRPIESMFREIVINAIDAHREAKQDKPISIHIPTAWDETFFIRDYGKGLKHNDFMDIYLAYGASSRRDSDAVHGGLGLGTKSPLAYTSTFAVSSFVDGFRNDYLVYYDEDNLPCVDHRNCEKTFEDSGLLVSLTLTNSHDYINFEDAAIKILGRIPADKYIIESGCAARPVVPINEGSVYDNIRIRDGSGIYIVMGYVAYQMDAAAVLTYLNSKDTELEFDGELVRAADVIRHLSTNQTVEILSEIGAYPVHPSREYVNVTPRAVKKLCADISQGLETAFKVNEDESVDIRRDVLQTRLVGAIPPKKAQISMRGRFLSYVGWGTSGRISEQINTYGAFIRFLVRNDVPCVYAAGLESTQLTDYLGNKRTVYDFSGLMQTPGILQYGESQNFFVFDTSVIEASGLQDVLSAEYKPLDLMALAAAYADQRDTRSAQSAPYMYQPRTVVRSMQDKSHNILMLKSGCNGTHKRDWQSQKMNVADLEALGKQIFWVPTYQGCIKSVRAISDIDAFFVSRTGIPKWRTPVIIGLPASKGTKTIEAAFQPIAKLEAYTKKIYASDSYKRKQQLRVQYTNTLASSYVRDYAAYGTANWTLRLNALAHKYDIMQVILPDDVGDIPEVIKSEKDSIELRTRLPFSHQYYGSYDSAAARQWGEQLAKLTNNFPTGAKAKNDPYYLSR